MSHHSANNHCTDASQLKEQPRVRYFIIRDGSTPVPLVPVDELPKGVALQGVSVTMRPEQTYGLKFVGYASPPGSRFVLAPPDRSHDIEHPYSQRLMESVDDIGMESKPYLAPDAIARASSQQSLSLKIEGRPRGASPTASKPEDQNNEGDSSSGYRPVRGGRGGRNRYSRARGMGRSGFGRPNYAKKEYCTHWITKGTCDYGQQGCRFKHVMPTKAKLEEMEIFEWPEWWLRRNGALKDRRELENPINTADERVKRRWWRREAEIPKDPSTPDGQLEEALEDGFDGKKKLVVGGKTFVPRRRLHESQRAHSAEHQKADRSRRSSNSSDLIQLSPSVSALPLRLRAEGSDSDLRRQRDDAAAQSFGPTGHRSATLSAHARTETAVSFSNPASKSVEEHVTGAKKHDVQKSVEDGVSEPLAQAVRHRDI